MYEDRKKESAPQDAMERIFPHRGKLWQRLETQGARDEIPMSEGERGLLIFGVADMDWREFTSD